MHIKYPIDLPGAAHPHSQPIHPMFELAVVDYRSRSMRACELCGFSSYVMLLALRAAAATRTCVLLHRCRTSPFRTSSDNVKTVAVPTYIIKSSRKPPSFAPQSGRAGIKRCRLVRCSFLRSRRVRAQHTVYISCRQTNSCCLTPLQSEAHQLVCYPGRLSMMVHVRRVKWTVVQGAAALMN